ncbi:MAG: hypothetical protein K2X11_08820 [Acetobacteraceae bacterium]|nr:hypothetical protein [Acetobacteraceae bacterium]
MDDKEWLHTLKLMGMAMVILFGGIAAFAVAWGGQSPWPVEAPADRYLSLGSEKGTNLLARDLAGQHPPGSDLHAALNRLRQVGLDCRADGARSDAYTCGLQVNRGDRRYATRLEIRVEGEGRSLRMIAPPDRG